ncbi:MAG TPA: MBL fold metallo-hydrolase [Planctomycetota bacterium]|nr:MBL fold metallo-hydrolase [Planctomycetota bacterium]
MARPSAAAGNPFAPRDYGRLETLSPRVHLWRNIVNSSVFVGERGIAVFDTQVNHALARRLRAHLERTFAKPILYAVNTHYHWDHTNGNAVFKEVGATIVASRRTAVAMVERAPRQKGFLASRGFDLGPDPLQPDVYAEDLARIDLGGLTIELVHGLDAETADPTIAWCAAERVAVAGDTVMTGSFPIFGQPSQREGLEDAGWLAALDQLRAFKPEAILPGHGPVARDAEMQLLERICRYFLDEVAKHRAAGRDLAETMRVMEDEMPAWLTRIPVVWGTPRYAILRAWAGLADLGQPGWQHVKPSAIPRDAAALTRAPRGDAAAWREAIAQVTEGGDVAGAVSLAEAACAAHPGSPELLTTLAATLIAASRGVESVLEKGDCFDAARAALDAALRIDPGYGPALLQLGQFFTMMAFRNGDDPRHGESLLEKASADPRLSRRQRAEVAFYRGIAARARGDELDAKRRFGEALAADAGYHPAMLATMG